MNEQVIEKLILEILDVIRMIVDARTYPECNYDYVNCLEKTENGKSGAV